MSWGPKCFVKWQTFCYLDEVGAYVTLKGGLLVASYRMHIYR